jgi:hypothetical protein
MNSIGIIDAKNQGKRVVTSWTHLGPKYPIFYGNGFAAIYEQLGFSPKLSIQDHVVVLEF